MEFERSNSQRISAVEKRDKRGMWSKREIKMALVFFWLFIILIRDIESRAQILESNNTAVKLKYEGRWGINVSSYTNFMWIPACVGLHAALSSIWNIFWKGMLNKSWFSVLISIELRTFGSCFYMQLWMYTLICNWSDITIPTEHSSVNDQIETFWSLSINE